MNTERIPKIEMLYLAIGEAIVTGIITAVYLIIGKFNYTVILGAVLGSLVTVANFVFLCISVNRALDKTLLGVDMTAVKRAYEARDAAEAKKSENEEDADTEASEGDVPEYEKIIAKYQSEQQESFKTAVKLSYTVRNIAMVATLVIAFLSKQFDLIATVIPLFMLRPILTVAELVGRKEK